MSDIKMIADYLRKYNAWRRAEDERTMDEAGIVPAELGRMIDAAVAALDSAPDMSRIALRKVEQMGGTPCGVLVRNEAGAIASVSDMGRVTRLDDCVVQGDCKGECVLPGQAVGTQAVPEPDMFWDADDAEQFGGCDAQEFADNTGCDLLAGQSMVVRVQCAVQLPSRWMKITAPDETTTQWEWVQPPQEGEDDE